MARRPTRSASRMTEEGVARLLLGALACLCAVGLALWGAGALALVLSGRDPLALPLSRAPELALSVLAHPRRPALGWPGPLRSHLPPPALLYLAAACWPLPALYFGRRLLGARRRPRGPGPAAWAEGREARPLQVRGPLPGRLVLGTLGRGLIAAEAAQSLLVLGPTQSGKTSGLAIPALLEWQGPAVATSVKGDLLRETADWRSRLGRVQVFDPAAVSGRPSAPWSPLAAAASWAGARRTAAGLCSVASARGGGVEDGAFWFATAEKLLAPLLFAAATSGASMADVVRWVDAVEVDEVLDALEVAGVPEALLAAEASFRRDARQLSSVYATAETVLAAFADPTVRAASDGSEVRAEALLDGGAHTLYLVAPPREQERLAPVFVTLLREVLAAAFARAEAEGGRLASPLLVVLDEAANIAPLDDLDTIASTAAAHGVQLVTVFQDLAQLDARYGRRGATVLNNHRAKLLCPGVSDGATLRQLSELIGDAEEVGEGESIDADGRRAVSRSPRERRLAPADRLRRLAAGEAVLLYGNLDPMRLRLRPWFEDRALAARARSGEVGGALSGRPRGRRRGRRARGRVPAHASRGSRHGRRGARRSGRSG